jgi:hypothetical protein
MMFYIDEAGDFALPPSVAEHRVAVVAAIAFSDAAWRAVKPRYVAFRQTLPSAELRGGEPRWHLLSKENRRRFCSMLTRDNGVSLTPVTLDLSHLVGTDWLTPMLDRLAEQPGQMLFDTAKEQMAALYRQARNLSPVQHLRIYAWAYALYQALYHAILFLGHGPDRSSWDAVRIEIDAVQRAPKARETRVFQLMVLAWLAGWSRGRPFLTIEGVHTPDHPFVQKYDSPDGIDLGKLVRPNLHWGVSANNEGLQIADLTAGAVHAAASTLGSDPDILAMYALLMTRASHYGAAVGPGLFSPLAIPLPDVEAKYEPLSRVMGGTGLPFR